MSTGSLLLIAAVILLVGLYLARPLLATSHQRSRTSARQELLSQKETILTQIDILDFDYETGKLPELVYKQQRRQMIGQASDILKKLDEFADLPEPSGANSIQSEIEAAIAAHRQPRPQPKPQSPTLPAESAISLPPTPEPTAAATNGQVKFCSQCGQPVDKGDKFCANCGHKVLQT
jgi:hypothetical protein